jgi:predicted lipoprotein with Yx(FWY)xxD motif
MRWKRGLQVAAAGLVFATLAGCGAFSTKNDATPSPVGQAAQAQEDTKSGTAALVAADSDKLGKILNDDKGFTLYRFDNDTAKPSKSNCEGDCATAWPPVTASVDSIEQLEAVGMDGKLIGTVERSDGSVQLTVAGWPVYRYFNDASPGDINGQGAGNRWFAVTPEGKKATGQAAPGAPGAPGAPVAPAPPVSLAAMKVGSFGEIVTDREGMTLYRFDKDTANPSKSNCDGECAAKWPPVIATSDKFELQGIDQSKVGTVVRTDGTRQVTIAGWPVYRFAGDSKSCDTNGQGVGGVWFVIKPDGKKAS